MENEVIKVRDMEAINALTIETVELKHLLDEEKLVVSNLNKEKVDINHKHTKLNERFREILQEKLQLEDKIQI